jgi:hypothetical protein
MKNKGVLISIGIIALLLLYLVFAGRSRKSGDIPNISSWKGAVDEIDISKKEIQFKIIQKDGKWFVNGEFPADKEKVDSIEKNLRELDITDFISNGSYYQQYDLTPEKAVRVTAKKGGDILRDLYIGKPGSSFRNTYVKLDANGRIYLASGNLADPVNVVGIDDLRDKQIHQFNSADITSLELNYHGSISFEKKEKVEKDKKINKGDIFVPSGWTSRNITQTEIDNAKIDALADAFLSLKAEAFPAVKANDLTSVLCTVKAAVKDKKVEFTIHKKDGEFYLCTSSASPYVFTVREWAANKFLKNISDFKKKIK